ncbi:MAG: hypothetical protein ACM3VW_04205 [Bacteroidota bacterium]
MNEEMAGLPPQLLRKLEFAQRNLRAIGSLSVVGGVFALVFMLLMAYRLGIGFVNMTYISFLTGGAVAFALGIGLLSMSDAARAAGSVWFLAWGVLELVLGFLSALYLGDKTMGIFCVVGGVMQLVFADLLHLPAEVFFTAYCGGRLEAQAIEEGLMKVSSGTSKPMQRFIDKNSAEGLAESA